MLNRANPTAIDRKTREKMEPGKIFRNQKQEQKETRKLMENNYKDDSFKSNNINNYIKHIV